MRETKITLFGGAALLAAYGLYALTPLSMHPGKWGPVASVDAAAPADVPAHPPPPPLPPGGGPGGVDHTPEDDQRSR